MKTVIIAEIQQSVKKEKLEVLKWEKGKKSSELKTKDVNFQFNQRASR